MSPLNPSIIRFGSFKCKAGVPLVSRQKLPLAQVPWLTPATLLSINLWLYRCGASPSLLSSVGMKLVPCLLLMVVTGLLVSSMYQVTNTVSSQAVSHGAGD